MGLAVFLLILGACSKFTNDMVCIPNYSQGNIGMKVTYLVGSYNEFEFEVCYNDSFQGDQVSIYGVETAGDIAQISTVTDIRLARLTDGLYPGDRFSVQFANDDAWFVIYKDFAGNPATNSEVLRGEFR